MNPNEFYKRRAPQVNGQKFVLGLFPESSKSIFEDEIKPAIESGEGEVKFRSYLDPGQGMNIIENILDDMQNANLIITDISGFEPNVMYELGIALVKNEKNVIICDKKSHKRLPFYLTNNQVHVYDDTSKKSLNAYIHEQIIDLIPEERHKCSFKDNSKDDLSEIDRYLHQQAFSAAHVIWDRLKENEGDNVCVDELKAKIFLAEAKVSGKERNLERSSDKLDAVRTQYENILKKQDLSRSFRSSILIELAKCHLYYRPRRTEEALEKFWQAETFYNRSPLLYQDWAYACHLNRNHELALEKIERANALTRNNDNDSVRQLCQFYFNWRINNNYNVGLRKFLIENKRIDSGPRQSDRTNHNQVKTNPVHHNPQKENYHRFKKEIVVGSIVSGMITRIKKAGVDFQTLGNISGVEGFVGAANLPDNFSAVFRVGETINAQYTGPNNDRQSIFAKNIQKINSL